MKSCRLQPYILALRTLITTGLDQLPGSNHATSVLLYAGRCNPAWGMLWVRLDKRIEKHPSPLDITNFGLRFEHNAVEIREVPFGVD